MKTFSRVLTTLDRQPRLNVGLRILMAVFGSYGVAWLGAAALAAGLPMSSPTDAVTLAIILAFLLYLAGVLWVFASATLWRAALGLATPAALFGTWLNFAIGGAVR